MWLLRCRKVYVFQSSKTKAFNCLTNKLWTSTFDIDIWENVGNHTCHTIEFISYSDHTHQGDNGVARVQYTHPHPDASHPRTKSRPTKAYSILCSRYRQIIDTKHVYINEICSRWLCGCMAVWPYALSDLGSMIGHLLLPPTPYLPPQHIFSYPSHVHQFSWAMRRTPPHPLYIWAWQRDKKPPSYQKDIEFVLILHIMQPICLSDSIVMVNNNLMFNLLVWCTRYCAIRVPWAQHRVSLDLDSTRWDRECYVSVFCTPPRIGLANLSVQG